MNILITGAISQAQECKQKLEKMGHIIYFQQFENENLCCAYDWVEGVICNGLFLHHSIEKFVNLRYIQLTSAGYDRVPIDYVKKRGITIHNARGVYSIPMAEWTILKLMEVYKESYFFRQNQLEQRWKKKRNLEELYGKTAMIFGFGDVGGEIAKRLCGFGVSVIGVATSSKECIYADKVISESEASKYLGKADMVIMTLPLTDKTKNLVNKTFLKKMKNDAIFMNLSRGEVVKEEDLLCHLEEGRLRVAILDVFRNEPLDSTSKWWQMERVIVTPHNSFASKQNGERLMNLIIRNLSSIEIEK